MDDLGLRLVVLVRVLVPFLFMMATVYLAAHILCARLISSPESQALAFFAIVTSPLTRPIRSFLPPGTPDARVRAVAFAVYCVLWIVTDRVARTFGPTPSG
jgi:hypothetical protein